MAFNIGAVVARFSVDNKQFNRAIKAAEKNLEGFKGTVNRISGVATKAFVGVATAVGAVGTAVTVLGNKAVNAASDLSEAQNAVNVIFGESADTLLDFSKKAEQAAGLSQEAFLNASVPIGAALKNVGFSAEEAANESVNLTQRAADMASIFNTDLDDALGAIQAGLRGEADPLERFGVGLSAANIEAFALKEGIIGANEEMTDQQKVTARLGLLMEQTNDIAGDFVNTSDQLANRQRINKARIENLTASYGKRLIPIKEKVVALTEKVIQFFEENEDTIVSLIEKGYAKLVDIVKKVIQFFQDLREGIRKATEFYEEHKGVIDNVVIVLASLAAGFLIVKGIIVAVAAVFTAITLVVKGFAIAVAFLTSPFALVAIAIGAVIAIGVLLWKNWDWISEQAGRFGRWIVSVFKDFWKNVTWVFNSIIEAGKAFWNNMVSVFKSIVSTIGSVLSTLWDIITWPFRQAISFINGLLSSFDPGHWMRKAVTKARNGLSGIKDAIVGPIRTAVTKANEWLQGLLDKLDFTKRKAIEGDLSIRQGTGQVPSGSNVIVGFGGPNFAKGVRNFSGGTALVGEEGPELVNLPRGADVFTNDETRGMMGGVTIQNMNIAKDVDWQIGANILARKLRTRS